MTDPKIAEKIKKLFALGESDNPNESAVALRMAQELMEKHQLTMGAIHLSGVTHADVRSRSSVSQLKAHENLIMWTVSRAFGCFLVFYPSVGKNWAQFRLIGGKAQVPIAAYTGDVLMRKLAHARAEFVKNLPEGYTAKDKTMEADGFCIGWGRAIAETVSKFAGVTEEMTLAIEEYKKVNLGINSKNLANVRDRKLGAAGYEAGRIAGAGESLYRPMGSDAAAGRVGQTFRIAGV